MSITSRLLVGFLAWETTVKLAQWSETASKYRQAEAYARNQGKPFLIIGGPHGSRRLFDLTMHGCGDTCLDLDAAACRGCPTIVVADVRDMPFSDAYFGAALASHVLEHLPSVQDAHEAILEMRRVAQRIFIASPAKGDVLAWFWPKEHRLWIQQAGDQVTIQPILTRRTITV